HGVTPEDAGYAYVLLPNKSADETAAYSQEPDVNVLENSKDLQTVEESVLGLTAVNFWQEGTMDFIRSDQAASVLVKEEGEELTLSVSDPTQKNDEVVVELKKVGDKVIEQDDSIEVLNTDPFIKVKVD